MAQLHSAVDGLAGRVAGLDQQAAGRRWAASPEAAWWARRQRALGGANGGAKDAAATTVQDAAMTVVLRAERLECGGGGWVEACELGDTPAAVSPVSGGGAAGGGEQEARRVLTLVECTGAAADVAAVLVAKRNAGAGKELLTLFCMHVLPKHTRSSCE